MSNTEESEERFLYDDADGMELAYDALREAYSFLERYVTAHEVTSEIVKGSPKHPDDQDVMTHAPRVRTLLEKLVKSDRVNRHTHYKRNYYSPVLGR